MHAWELLHKPTDGNNDRQLSGCLHSQPTRFSDDRSQKAPNRNITHYPAEESELCLKTCLNTVETFFPIAMRAKSFPRANQRSTLPTVDPRDQDAHLVRERPYGGAESPGKTEVGDLKSAVAADQKVLGLQVPARVCRGNKRSKLFCSWSGIELVA